MREQLWGISLVRLRETSLTHIRALNNRSFVGFVPDHPTVLPRRRNPDRKPIHFRPPKRESWFTRLVCLWLGLVAVNWFALEAQPYGLDSRAPIGPFLNHVLPKARGVEIGGWTAVEAFPNVTFDDPVCITPEPGSNRLFIRGRQGTIHFITNTPATMVKTLFLDLTPVTQGYDDCGLLGIVFHPEWRVSTSANRGYVYVCYQCSPAP